MGFRLMYIFTVAAMIMLPVLDGSAQPASDGQTTETLKRRWYNRIHDGRYHSMSRRQTEALDLYEEAFRFAQNDEERVDTLLAVAEAYEGLSSRTAAIQTYKRILKEYPESGHTPRVAFRLGELHRSISLLPASTPRAEMERVITTEMTDDKSRPYFEKALATGAALNPWVLSSKAYLSLIYKEAGREQEAMDLARELATLDIYSIKEPDYVGPYARMNAPERTLNERIDEVRARAAKGRIIASRRLVAWSVAPGDSEETLVKMRVLIKQYPGTEIEKFAREEEARALEKMKQSLRKIE